MALFLPSHAMTRLISFSALAALLLNACKKDDHPPVVIGDGDGDTMGDGDGDTVGDGDVGGGGNGPDTGDGGGDGSGDGDGDTGSGGGTGGTVPANCDELVCPATSSGCVETAYGPSCDCLDGFSGTHCLDTNECEPGAAPVCGQHATCENTYGSYDCICGDGYVMGENGCDDYDECAAEPCSSTADCNNDEGSYSCSCKDGNFGNGFFCQAEDECAGDPCGENGSCVVVDGAHRCQCDPGFQGITGCTACSSNLEISDPGLRAAINVQLGRAAEDSSAIPVSSLADTPYLNARSYEVASLDGLECWSSLTWLDLSENTALTAIDEIAALNQLDRLNLSCTGVTDLSPLSNHPALSILNIDLVECGEIPNSLAPLGSIAQLKELSLNGHGSIDLAELSGLKALEVIAVGENGLDGLEELADARLLRSLNITSNSLTSLESVAQLTSLQQLSIGGNLIEDLDPLLSLTQLQYVSARNNLVRTLPDLSSLTQLTDFDIGQNQIDSVEPLASASSLSWTDFSENQVTSLSTIVNAPLGGTIMIAGNPLSCATEQGNIDALRARGVEIIGECEE